MKDLRAEVARLLAEAEADLNACGRSPMVSSAASRAHANVGALRDVLAMIDGQALHLTERQRDLVRRDVSAGNQGRLAIAHLDPETIARDIKDGRSVLALFDARPVDQDDMRVVTLRLTDRQHRRLSETASIHRADAANPFSTGHPANADRLADWTAILAEIDAHAGEQS